MVEGLEVSDVNPLIGMVTVELLSAFIGDVKPVIVGGLDVISERAIAKY